MKEVRLWTLQSVPGGGKIMEEMKKINVEELEKVCGGGDYDFIHYTDGKSCRHYFFV